MEDTDSFGWTPLHFVSGFNLPGLLGVHLGWRVANRTRVSTHFSKVCVCVCTHLSARTHLTSALIGIGNILGGC